MSHPPPALRIRSIAGAALATMAALLILPLAPLAAQAQWMQPEGATRLTGRTGFGLAHDIVRSRSVLFGGLAAGGVLDETWEWDGVVWQQRFPAVRPPARTGCAMAYDVFRGRAVLFGGQSGSLANVTQLGDLWEWDGENWLQRLVPGPSPRTGAAMVHDPARARIVMFGGSTSGIAVTDPHWEWDGVAWTEGPAGPPARLQAGLAHDAVRNRTVLFGGLGNCRGSQCPTFADTWEYDGSSWTQIPASGPGSRHSPAMAYDVAGGTVVMTGGQGGCMPACSLHYDDTWKWNGTQWSRVFTTAPRIHGAGMVYDLANGRCTLFGGTRSVTATESWLSAETFTFDGAYWNRVAAPPTPPPSGADALAYDAVRQQVLWFGNASKTSLGRAGTFVFDGAAWNELTPPLSPPPRLVHALALDTVRQRIVLFGGAAVNGGALADTWEWDGATWIQRMPAQSPPAQYSHAMAFDTLRGVTVLCPGIVGRNEFYEYDGNTWTLRAAPSQPSFRPSTALAFDQGRGRTVLLGWQANSLSAETWLWDGSAWVQAMPAVIPPALTGVRMAYDGLRDRVVLIGARDAVGPVLLETWEWDGTNWSQLTGPGPSARNNLVLAYDARRGRLVAFGGRAGPGSFGYLQDTWELVVGCDRQGPGEVAGSGLPLSCDSAPRLGRTFCVGYGNGNPNAAGVHFLLLTPGSCSATPGVIAPPLACAPSLLYGMPLHVLLALGSRANFCFPVPNQPVFVGTAFCCQGSSFEGPGCLRATAAIQAVVR